MTEKRFTTSDPTVEYSTIVTIVWDSKECKHLIVDEVVDCLNELHEERNYFERKKCEYWNKFNLAHLDNINLQKENEQLKKELHIEQTDCKNAKESRDYWRNKAKVKGGMMSDKRFISEYVEIIDENGSRQAVCVTDNEHTVSFEVKDEIVAMTLCERLNSLWEENERLKARCPCYIANDE